MRWIAKIVLFLVTVALPVFIAACYGPSQRYAKDGRPVGPKPMRIIDEQTDPAGQAEPEKEQDAEAEDEQD